MKRADPAVSNPGPSWGFATIGFLEKYLPAVLFHALLDAGTFIGLLVMPRQRRFSRDYLITLTGQAPGIGQQFRHFRAFMDGLVLKLRSGHGKYPRFQFAPEAHKTEFLNLCESSRQALFGTFHVGYSDMMGCMLKNFDRKVSMVRLRVGNSLDTDVMESTFAGFVRFLWINNPGEFIFQLKEAIQEGQSIGLQCDRTEFGSKTANFQFLGCQREFPMTIYFLADLFKLPVVFAFTGPLGRNMEIEAYTSEVFEPGEGREDNMRRAEQHFQGVLSALEAHLKKHPELWFNFIPLGKCSDSCEKAQHA